MMIRRELLACLGAAAVAGCSGAATTGPRSTNTVLPADLRPVRNPGFDAWLTAFRPRARAKGVSDATLDYGLRGAGFLPGVVTRDRNQTEFKRSLEDYLAIVAREDKVTFGKQRFAQYRGTLNAIESRYGVPAHVMAGVWGVESYFGTRRGDIPVISATATLAYDGRRGAFFEAQLVSALKILQNGHTTLPNLKGSWAGAMGHTQFIPTTFDIFAVDFNGDGRRDMWSDDPTDALASVANHFSKSGWRRGEPWGYEVALPAGFNTGVAGRGKYRSLSEWQSLGIRKPGGGALTGPASGALLAPAGSNGPGFMVFRNFDVFLRYNQSENYAIGVGYMSDRLNGSGPLRGRFGPDRNGLTQADRKELQQRLTRAGFDAGDADGVLGSKTESAISAYQAAKGLPVTGQPSAALLQSLR